MHLKKICNLLCIQHSKLVNKQRHTNVKSSARQDIHLPYKFMIWINVDEREGSRNRVASSSNATMQWPWLSGVILHRILQNSMPSLTCCGPPFFYKGKEVSSSVWSVSRLICSSGRPTFPLQQGVATSLNSWGTGFCDRYELITKVNCCRPSTSSAGISMYCLPAWKNCNSWLHRHRRYSKSMGNLLITEPNLSLNLSIKCCAIECLKIQI